MNPHDFLPTAPGKLLHTAQDYWAFLPQSLPPALHWTPDLANRLAEAERALGQLGEVSVHFSNPHWMVQSFVRQEAVLSSRIEGTRTSLVELYAYEAEQLTFLPAAADAREVYNYVQALDYGLQRLDSLPVSLRLVREMHARLLAGVRGEQWTPGEFRRSQNWIGAPGSTLNSAVYVPPPVDEMHIALHQLEEFIHAPSDMPALARLALIHYQFEAIHPFLDGNGRVGRLLIALLMCEWKLLPLPLLYLSAYFEARRNEYYARLLAVSQRGEWHEWLAFFLDGVHQQAWLAAGLGRSLQTLQTRYHSQLAGQRDLSRLMQVVEYLFGHPLTTIRQVQEALQMADYTSAQRSVRKLEQMGILQEISGRERNRIYRAPEILAAIQQANQGND
jgi:Fic family protein